MASGGENYGKNNTTEVSGWSKGNSFKKISNTGEISAQAAQEQQAAPPAPSPMSRVQPSSGGNYGYSAIDDNKVNVSGWSKRNSIGNAKNNTTEVSGWSNANSFKKISNTEVGNGNKISAQSAQEQQLAPDPSPSSSGVQPPSGGNHGYSTIDDNNGNSVGNVGNISNTGVGNLNKILAQEQPSAPVQPLRIGEQPSSGGNCGYGANKDNSGSPVGNNGNIINGTGDGNLNKISAQSEQLAAPPVPPTWSGGVVQPSGGGNYGYSAGGDNKMGFSGWSEGNSVGNIRNAGVRTNSTESTPRCSCCSFTMCS